MSRSAIVFWGAALAVTALFTLATAFFLPYERLGLTGPTDRMRAWHLCLWTGGVMSILFGTSALIGLITPIGFREAHEAGSVTAALEARRKARMSRDGFHSNFAWWLVCTGVMLIAVYFVAWAYGPGLTP